MTAKDKRAMSAAILTSIILASLVVFLYSYFLSAHYVGGDQEIYRLAYSELSKLSISDGIRVYAARILTLELGHYVITWVASRFFDKDLFMAISNAILAYYAIKVLRGWGGSLLIVIWIVLFSFYFIALYLSAERLKFAFLFFAIAINCTSRVRAGGFFIVSLLTHLQMLLAVVMGIISKSGPLLKSLLIKGRLKFGAAISAIAIFLISGCLFLYFDRHIYSKISAYHGGTDAVDYLRIAIFFLLSLLYANGRRLHVVFLFLILSIAVLFVGETRINIFGYFAFLHFALPYKGGFNIGVLSTTAYYSYGWAKYAMTVLQCGSNIPC
ncbi:hypothetical protein [Polycyclovorans algicola]|uniref:hypothetical protein n=1 Tax=Polycyclovorans algicola TaxID=616992 RepID=UPI0012697F79|nr:hypothetical protein [Polycyclovorans algicola]